MTLNNVEQGQQQKCRRWRVYNDVLLVVFCDQMTPLYLDYCNSLLADLPCTHHRRTITTCTECCFPYGAQSWLPWSRDSGASAAALATCGVQNQVQVVCIDLMHQIHTGRAPQYLVDSVHSVAESSRRPGLRSANTANYVKRCTRTKFDERCFSHAGPAVWKSFTCQH